MTFGLKQKKREDWKDVEEYLKEYVEEFYEIAETSEIYLSLQIFRMNMQIRKAEWP